MSAAGGWLICRAAEPAALSTAAAPDSAASPPQPVAIQPHASLQHQRDDATGEVLDRSTSRHIAMPGAACIRLHVITDQMRLARA